MEYRTFITKFRAAAGAVAFAGMIATSGTALATPAADVIFVVDESGSMSGEHAWLGTMVASMEANLIAAGVGGGIDKNR
jgi:Mg-chelatase subunit ChlD